MPTTMKAVRIHRFGGPEVLEEETIPIPQPRDDEILVRVYAASVNPVDYKIRLGRYPPVKEGDLPVTLGRDVSGVVAGRGANVESFRPGDAVFAMLTPERGGYAEYAIVKASKAAPKPGKVDHIRAAAVPLAGLTAWQGLFDHGQLKAGQRVLIHGGSGGVGHFAIQFARAKGAEVLATASGEHVDFLRELGAEEAIDYKAERFEDVARDVDLVFDLVDGETQDRSFAVLRPGGTIISTLKEPSQEKAAAISARAAHYMAQPNGRELAEIGRLIDDGKVRVTVDAVYSLADAGVAQERLEQGKSAGKTVLSLMA